MVRDRGESQASVAAHAVPVSDKRTSPHDCPAQTRRHHLHHLIFEWLGLRLHDLPTRPRPRLVGQSLCHLRLSPAGSSQRMTQLRDTFRLCAATRCPLGPMHVSNTYTTSSAAPPCLTPSCRSLFVRRNNILAEVLLSLFTWRRFVGRHTAAQKMCLEER